MSKFKVGDAVVLVNADSYSYIMRQLVGVSLVVRTVENDRCGCEVVCAGVPGGEGWFLRSDDLRLVSAAEPTGPTPVTVQKPIRRGDLVEYNGDICVVFSKGANRDGEYRIAPLTGRSDYYWPTIDKLTRLGSVRKKIKQLREQKES